VLSHYDIETPISVILERHQDAFPNDLECSPGRHFRHLADSDFAFLVNKLQAPSDASLKHIVGQILEYDFAWASDNDIGWIVYPDRPVRIEKMALCGLLASSDVQNPTRVREILAVIYKMEFPVTR